MMVRFKSLNYYFDTFYEERDRELQNIGQAIKLSSQICETPEMSFLNTYINGQK